MTRSRFRFAVEGAPVPKPRMTQRDQWEVRPSVARYREYADAVRAACIDAKRTMGLPDDFSIEDPVSVKAIFGRDFTLIEVETIEGKVIKPKGSGDLDNYGKAMIEGLHPQKSGVASLVPILIGDDRQVAWIELGFVIENGSRWRIDDGR
ncbi:hypothetical protein ES705_18375 [subsurface metagenome]